MENQDNGGIKENGLMEYAKWTKKKKIGAKGNYVND